MAAPSTTDGLLEAIRRELGNRDVDWARAPQPLTGGFWAEMYRVSLAGDERVTGELVARIVPEPTTGAREALVQRHIADLGYPTPRVRLSGPPSDELDRAWLLMDHAPGSPLLASLSGPSALLRLPVILRAVPDQLAQHSASLHAIDAANLDLGPDDLGGLLDHMADEASSIDDGALVERIEALRRARPDRGTHVICHGDLHPFNILSHGDGDSVLDWSTMRLAEAEYDLAYTRIMLRNPPLTAHAALRPILDGLGRFLDRRFLRSYIAHGGATPDTERLDWYRRLHQLRVVGEVAVWEARGELDDHADHPFLDLVGTFST